VADSARSSSRGCAPIRDLQTGGSPRRAAPGGGGPRGAPGAGGPAGGCQMGGIADRVPRSGRHAAEAEPIAPAEAEPIAPAEAEIDRRNGRCQARSGGGRGCGCRPGQRHRSRIHRQPARRPAEDRPRHHRRPRRAREPGRVGSQGRRSSGRAIGQRQCRVWLVQRLPARRGARQRQSAGRGLPQPGRRGPAYCAEVQHHGAANPPGRRTDQTASPTHPTQGRKPTTSPANGNDGRSGNGNAHGKQS